MTVSRMIEHLAHLDPDATVCVPAQGEREGGAGGREESCSHLVEVTTLLSTHGSDGGYVVVQ